MITREIKLPSSGSAVTIRRPGGLDQLLLLGGLPKLPRQFVTDGNPAAMEAHLQQDHGALEAAQIAAARRACRCCINPKFAVPDQDGSLPYGHQDINDLDLTDYLFLLNAVQTLAAEGEQTVSPLSKPEVATSS